jgi:hypothetical protein
MSSQHFDVQPIGSRSTLLMIGDCRLAMRIQARQTTSPMRIPGNVPVEETVYRGLLDIEIVVVSSHPLIATELWYMLWSTVYRYLLCTYCEFTVNL